MSAWTWVSVALALLIALSDPAAMRVRRLSSSLGVRADEQAPRRRSSALLNGSRGVIIATVSGSASILLLAPWPHALALMAAFVIGVVVLLPRLESRADRSRGQERLRTLPLALDLLAACWSAGATPRRAAGLVAEGVDAPLADDLRVAAARLELGAPAADAWAFLRDIDDDGAARDAYRALIDAAVSGAPPVDALRRAARRARDARRRKGEAAARTVAVKVAAPLGLCFLPAFVLLAIAPAVMGALLPAFG